MYLVGKLDEKSGEINYTDVCNNMIEVKAMVARWAVLNNIVTDICDVADDRNVIVQHTLSTASNPEGVYLLYYRDKDAQTHRYGSCVEIHLGSVDKITPNLRLINNKRKNVFPIQIDMLVKDQRHTIGYATTVAAANDIISRVNLPDWLNAKLVSTTNEKYSPSDRTMVLAMCDMIKMMLQGDSGITI